MGIGDLPVATHGSGMAKERFVPIPPPLPDIATGSTEIDPAWVQELRGLLADLRVMATATAKRSRLMDFLSRGFKLPMNVLSADDRAQAIWLLRTQQAELMIGTQKEYGLDTPTELLAVRSNPFSLMIGMLRKPRPSAPSPKPEEPKSSASNRT
jgi:hypothetical protein